jgi:hypothetical protein
MDTRSTLTRAPRPRVLVIAATALVSLILPATSAASSSSSAPIALDRTGAPALTAVDCPASNRCVDVDVLGQEVTRSRPRRRHVARGRSGRAQRR